MSEQLPIAALTGRRLLGSLTPVLASTRSLPATTTTLRAVPSPGSANSGVELADWTRRSRFRQPTG
eukprot:8539007-Alexandrium_andersonii.AAC.1